MTNKLEKVYTLQSKRKVSLNVLKLENYFKNSPKMFKYLRKYSGLNYITKLKQQ